MQSPEWCRKKQVESTQHLALVSPLPVSHQWEAPPPSSLPTLTGSSPALTWSSQPKEHESYPWFILSLASHPSCSLCLLNISWIALLHCLWLSSRLSHPLSSKHLSSSLDTPQPHGTSHEWDFAMSFPTQSPILCWLLTKATQEMTEIGHWSVAGNILMHCRAKDV